MSRLVHSALLVLMLSLTILLTGIQALSAKESPELPNCTIELATELRLTRWSALRFELAFLRLLEHDHLTTTELYLNLSPEDVVREYFRSNLVGTPDSKASLYNVNNSTGA